MTSFFISYNKVDENWAEWIAWVLEEEGHTTIIQAWDFRPGRNFVLDMQRATTETDKTIVVLSNDYLEAEFTQSEWATAFAADPKSLQRKLIPIRVRRCKPQGLLRPLIYVDLVQLKPKEARLAILSALPERLKPATAPSFPTSIENKTDQSQPAFPGSLSPSPVLSTNIGEDKLQEIVELFLERDACVLEGNRNRLLATQLGRRDIQGASTKGYVKCSKMITSLLKVRDTFQEGVRDVCSPTPPSEVINYVVDVQEVYEHSNNPSHSAEVSYSLVRTDEGLRIASLKGISAPATSVKTAVALPGDISISELHFTRQISRSDILDIVSILPETEGCSSARRNHPTVLVSKSSGSFWVIAKNQQYYLLPQNDTQFTQNSLRDLYTLYHFWPSQPDLELPMSISEVATVRPTTGGRWHLMKRGKLTFSLASLLARFYSASQIIDLEADERLGQIKHSGSVDCTSESLEQHCSGDITSPVVSPNENGNYWLLSDGEQHYLVPNPEVGFHKGTPESLPMLYDYPKSSNSLESFVLLQPAVLKALGVEGWQVIKRGKLLFN